MCLFKVTDGGFVWLCLVNGVVLGFLFFVYSFYDNDKCVFLVSFIDGEREAFYILFSLD